MSRSYNIWNEIDSCIYSTSKSYGIKEHSTIISNFGSSASHSKQLGKIEFNRKPLFENWFSYAILLDGKVIKRRYFNNKTKEFRKRLPTSQDPILNL